MKYYYPIKENGYSKAYKYVNLDNSELNEYWIVSYNKSTQTLITKSYDATFNLYNVFEEKINRDNAELITYTDYDKDQKEIISHVTSSNVYNSDKMKTYSYLINYINEFGRFEFEKERTFVTFEEIVFNNKLVVAAKFMDQYFIRAIDQFDEYTFSQNSYYVKDIGMVKYERFVPNEPERILQLEDILTLEEFKKLEEASR